MLGGRQRRQDRAREALVVAAVHCDVELPQTWHSAEHAHPDLTREARPTSVAPHFGDCELFKLGEVERVDDVRFATERIRDTSHFLSGRKMKQLEYNIGALLASLRREFRKGIY